MTAEERSLPWTPALVRVMAGLMIGLFLAAIDSTVVGTAIPTIARELGGFELYPWVFSGYLLTSTTSVPLWGRLADIRGRRVVILVGITLFVLGSVLCGLSANMFELIVFRTIQGIGAGCVQPLVFTIVGDIFPMGQRARLQGLFSGMWAIAAVVGPIAGATFVSTIGWRWIFDINLPIGVVSAILLWGYRERRDHVGGERLDVRGAALLTIGIAMLLYGLGTGTPGGRPIWPLVALAAIVLAAFAVVESRSPSPTVPLDLLRHGVIGPAIVVSVLAGTVMFGTTAYVPLYVQQVLHGSAFAAGAAISPMSLGWPVASVISGWTLMRVGWQRLLLLGGVFLVAGAAMLQFGPQGLGTLWISVASAIIGFGLGLFSAPMLIVIQNSVEWRRRGAATALNQFSRTIGGAVGVALMGIVLQAYVAGAADPLSATRQLAAGIHADFAGLTVAALALLAIGVVIMFRSRSIPTAESEARQPAAS